ncbi:hypothetical protein LTR95_001036 [Oleoguttula sp. CCFEE 5521]
MPQDDGTVECDSRGENRLHVENIGVSHFATKNLEKLLGRENIKTVHAVNQVERDPNNHSRKLIDYWQEKGIYATAYSCLGSTNRPPASHKTLARNAEEKGTTTTQTLLMWVLKHGTSIVPRSVTAGRIEAKFQLGGWSLTDE